MDELILNFPNADQVVVEYNRDKTTTQVFETPLTDSERDDIRWYLEVYGIQYTTDMDDERAERIVDQFKPWGEKLYGSVFQNEHAKRLFWRFYDALDDKGGLISIESDSPSVLSLPWELLCLNGRHLVHENPHISVRRSITAANGTGRRFAPKTKDTLHLLFVVSRPQGASFIDPRADAQAVMDALDANAPGLVTVEFLRPATLDNLKKRLKRQGIDHRGKPPVDILHFDGHGVFDTHGAMIRKAMKNDPSAAVRDAGKALKPDTGYLLFEDDDGQEALITSETLGDMLTNQKVALVVLSACQSGAVGSLKSNATEEEQETVKAINGVAARLIQAGLPSVIAMSHTVLVETTRRLFGEFYARLSDDLGVGAALDEARQHLYAHPERGERRRKEHDIITLTLQDWFLPALYQTGSDVPLLKPLDGAVGKTAVAPDSGENNGQLPPPPEGGFWGRSAELWAIERAFLSGTRRITVTGFGGQGKTALAAEAGRWLVRSGMFDCCCFVGFDAFQGVDAVESAVLPALRTVLSDNLTHPGDDLKALSQTAVLIILDNLESLMDGGDRQTALLAAAVAWSRAGDSRVIITTRQDHLDHAEYGAAMQSEHQYLPLDGLAENDAVDYFTALWALPPAPGSQIQAPQRHGLVELFKMVDFHPLSVSLLAYQLKTRKVADLGERLESLLADAPGEGAQKSLRASLDLSLERLAPEARQWLPGLGVFYGGAMEDVLLEVTGLGRAEDSEIIQQREILEALKNGSVKIKSSDGKELEGEEKEKAIENAIQQIEAELAQHQQAELTQGAEESTWPTLRQALETAGLIRSEHLSGVAAPYLKFHPALAPALWERLPDDEKASLLARHRDAYYRLSGQLYHQDKKKPHAVRATALRELPNLLFAVKAALAEGEEDAVDFVNNVNLFLYVFGMTRDLDDLNNLAEKVSEPGTRAWYLNQSDKGEVLLASGRHREAEAVFRNILKIMGETPTYDRQTTICRLGRCLTDSGRTSEAAAIYRDGIAMSAKLEPSDGVRRQTGILQTDLADALMLMGDYVGARVAYQAALEIDLELGDDRGAAVSNAQLGTLARREGDLAEAERRYQEALQTFRRMDEPASEATAQHQLGMLYRRVKKWDAAEAAYRESARLKESLGNRAGAADTYNNLAVAMGHAGRLAEAETWYRRAMLIYEEINSISDQAMVANNLANLIQSDADRLSKTRLSEARQLGEQALAIKQTLDPGAAEIWTTYNILAEIAEKQGEGDETRAYRRLGREARDNFLPNQQKRAQILKQFKEVIKAVLEGCEGNKYAQRQVEELFDTFQNGNWDIVDAIQAIWAGERDEEKLIEKIDYNSGVIIRAILASLCGEDVFQDIAETRDDDNEQTTADQQQLQIALAAALPILHPEARAQAEPLLDQLNQNGFTALTEAITRLWDGERDAAKLCEGLDEDDTKVMGLALHLIEHPEELVKLMGD